MAYGTLANIHSLTGSIFDDTQVNAAIVTSDQMIDGYIGDTTIASPGSALKAMGDQVASRILVSGIKIQNLASAKASDYMLPQLTTEEKAFLTSMLESEKVSYTSQDLDVSNNS